MNQIKNDKKRIFVAMSGGVDSSVAAAILKKQGHDVVGVYMKNWSGEEMGIKYNCPWEEDIEVLESVCKKLKIELRSYNFEKEYKKEVIDYFFREYEAGRTPNPDILCNSEIKFGSFLKRAIDEGADLIATGHYSRIIENEKGLYELHKGIDQNKDQSYFLHRLDQDQLSQSLFPIGGYEKSIVRKMAEELNLINAKRKDSQGICFVGKINLKELLSANISKKEGLIIDADSLKVIGKHEGVFFYTVGQREGIGVGGAGEPYYVLSKDLLKNELYVVKGADNPRLYSKGLIFEDVHFISGISVELPINCEVSVRYRQKPEKAELKILNNKYQVEFETPIRGITPGQSAVIYQKDLCLGGGIIEGSI